MTEEKQTEGLAENKPLDKKLWVAGKCINFVAFIMLCAVCAVIAVDSARLADLRTFEFSYIWLVRAGAVAGCAGSAVAVFLHLFNKRPLPNTARLNHISKKLVHTIIMHVALLVLYFFLMFQSLFEGIYGSFFLAFALIVVASDVLFVILFLFIKRLKTRYSSVGGVNLIDEISARSAEKMRLNAQAYDDKRTAQREAAGKLPKTAHEYERERRLKTWALIFADLLLMAVIFLFAAFCRGSIFNLRTMEKLHVDDNIGHACVWLGDPYDKRDTENRNGTALYGTWRWCSHPNAAKIAAKNKQIEKLTENGDDFSFDSLEKMMKLAEEISELETELYTTAADYISITHEGGKITGIRFDKNCYGRPSEYRTVSKITYAVREISVRDNTDNTTSADGYRELGGWLSADYSGEINIPSEIARNTEKLDDVAVRIYFTDGSLENKKIALNYALSDKAVQEAVWRDAYGEHAVKINLI